MGLFTYDVTLENIEAPCDGEPAAVPDEAGRIPDAFSFSSPAQPFENEFDEHPDLKRHPLPPLQYALHMYIGAACHP